MTHELIPIQTDSAPAAIGPYSQAIAVGDFVFCSGQIALDPETMELVGETAAEQANQVCQNLRAVVKAAGSSMDRIVRTTIYLVTMDDFADVNEVYGGYFDAVKPARATVAVKELPKGALVEIDCIATR